EDSQSFDKTNVFQNESIWLVEQINESLVTSTPDGRSVRPWLATSYKASNGGKRYTFKLRKGVRFSNGQKMTSADAKFSIDDARVVGQSVTFKRNPNYWQKGKPYLDKVTWSYVSDQNTRELQLRGGQIQVDEFPPFNAIDKLKKTSGVTMNLFPSTRTDYML